jgi:hypothetical protein
METRALSEGKKSLRRLLKCKLLGLVSLERTIATEIEDLVVEGGGCVHMVLPHLCEW